MKTIDEVIEQAVGDKINISGETGKKTAWGVDERLLRHNGFSKPLDTLTRSKAIALYHQIYVKDFNFDKIAKHSSAVAAELVDIAISLEPLTAVGWLQMLINGLTNRGEMHGGVDMEYAEPIVEDARCGPITQANFAELMEQSGDMESSVLKGLNCLQGVEMIRRAKLISHRDFSLSDWLQKHVQI